MADKVKEYVLKATRFIPIVVFLTIASICLITIGCIHGYTRKLVENEKVIDYTDCKNSENQICSSTLSSTSDQCSCIVLVNLTVPFRGVVSFHYELEFDQSSSEYKNSRDDQQLMGILSETPSEACEPFRYAEDKRPIAPCGKMADSFFLDTYSIMSIDANATIHFQPGILSEEERKGYKNPTNMSLLGSTFASPTSWPENIQIQKLKPTIPSDNGFQNERFIGWMKTDLKRKPIGLMDQTIAPFERGLEQGQYSVKITYRYSKYINGSRQLIFYSKDVVDVDNTASKVGLYIGCVVLVLTVIIAVIILRFYPSMINSPKVDNEPITNNTSVETEASSPELNPLKPNTNEQ